MAQLADKTKALGRTFKDLRFRYDEEGSITAEVTVLLYQHDEDMHFQSDVPGTRLWVVRIVADYTATGGDEWEEWRDDDRYVMALTPAQFGSNQALIKMTKDLLL